MCARIIELKNLDNNSKFEIGGKAKNLLKLMQAGISIPEAWVVHAEAFRQNLTKNELGDLAISAVQNPQEEICQQLRQAIFGMELHKELLKSFSKLPDVSLAVRSSASVEDGIQGSYSGLFKTCLGIKKDGLADAVRHVWASVFTPQVLTYHREVSPTSDYPLMAVLIMPLLKSKVAGVAFSANPTDGNPFQIVVTACLGLGTRVVDGTENCHCYTLDFETFTLIEMNLGMQKTGDFVQADGSVKREKISPDRRNESILSDKDLQQLGRIVRSVDEILGRRVDVEFAFHAKGLAILQAREILGLPSYFPDNPEEKDEGVGCSHNTWTDPISPFVRTISSTLKHKNIPPPPWPLEVNELFFHYGRMFYRLPTFPEYQEKPDNPWADRTFLKRMQSLDEPERDFQEWYLWKDDAYNRIIPSLRKRGKQLLSISESELDSMGMPEIGALLHEAIDLESQAGVFYIAASYPTAESLRRIQVLVEDWLMPSNLTRRQSWIKAQEVGLSLIQGSSTLTHEKDAELQGIAWGKGDLRDFIRKWGYSYPARDELIYISKWKSWREQPKPLHSAIRLLRASKDYRSIKQLVKEAVKKSNEILASTIKEIEATSQRHGKNRARIFVACVKACRRIFPMKDDRDLVLSHAQSALRWILMAASRRIRQGGIIQTEDDVFLFEPQELLEFFSNGGERSTELVKIIEKRRKEQTQLSRYTLPLTMYPQEKADEDELSERDVIHALPASPGIAEGKAHIVRDYVAFEDISDLEEGDILVLKGEGKVGLTMFFSSIAGLVYENGNMLCHEANLCRELGKPAVVCLGNKVNLIKEGETLRIDGQKGIVFLP